MYEVIFIIFVHVLNEKIALESGTCEDLYYSVFCSVKNNRGDKMNKSSVSWDQVAEITSERDRT